MSLNAQILTLRSVFVAMAAIQLATAASGTLVPLYFAEIGTSQEAASFAASAYSAGFLVGCFIVPRFMSDIGHIRAFAAGAAITTAGALLFSQSESAAALILLRFLIGLATASLFAIGDAWIGETAEEASRGRVLAIYAIVVGVVAVGSQAMVVLTPDELSEVFVFVGLLYCLSIIVIATTRTNPPDTGTKIQLRLRGLFLDAPAAASGVFAMGMVSTTILSVAPFNAAQMGIETRDIAITVGAIYLGRVLFQYPLGSLSDNWDRRVIILATTVISTVVLLAMAILADGDADAEPFDYFSLGFAVLMFLMIALGGSLLTLYSLLVAHAMDRTVPVFISSAAISMLFVWTLGSIAGPLISSVFTSLFGDQALLWVNFAAMLAYTAFMVVRIRKAEPAAQAERGSHIDILPTSTELAPDRKR